MPNRVLRWMVMTLIVCGAIPMALAAEHGGTTVSTKPSSSAKPPTTPSLSAKGTISGLDLQANDLKLTRAGDGQALTLMLDPKITTVWEGGKPMTLAQLKVGEKISVRYTSKAGKPVAKAIEIEAPAGTPAGAGQ